jgi:hypothetical protein
MELWKVLEPPLRAAAEEQGKPAARPGPVSPYEATARVSKSDAPGPQGNSGVRVRNDNEPPFVAQVGHSAPRMHAAAKIERLPEVQAANPAAWTWSMLTPPLANRSIRSVVFTATADSAIALSASGLVRWERGTWIPVSLPSHVPRGALRGLRWMRDGSVLIFGEGGFVARHVLGGATTIWRVPDPEITFLGALVEDNGTTTLVGERPYRGSAARAIPGPSWATR